MNQLLHKVSPGKIPQKLEGTECTQQMHTKGEQWVGGEKFLAQDRCSRMSWTRTQPTPTGSRRYPVSMYDLVGPIIVQQLKGVCRKVALI